MSEQETVIIQHWMTYGGAERWMDYSRCTPEEAAYFLQDKDPARWRAKDWITDKVLDPQVPVQPTDSLAESIITGAPYDPQVPTQPTDALAESIITGVHQVAAAQQRPDLMDDDPQPVGDHGELLMVLPHHGRYRISTDQLAQTIRSLLDDRTVGQIMSAHFDYMVNQVGMEPQEVLTGLPNVADALIIMASCGYGQKKEWEK